MSITRTSARSITVKNGFQAPYPVVQSLMGIIVLLAGLFPILHAVSVVLFGGRFYGLEAFLLAGLYLGGFLIRESFKRGYSIRIKFYGGDESWPILDNPTPEEMRQFLSIVRGQYGYEISES